MNKRQAKKIIKKALQDMRRGKAVSIINQAVVDKNGKPCDFKTDGAHLIFYKRPHIKRYKNGKRMGHQERIIEQTILDGERCSFCKKNDLEISRSRAGYQIKCNFCKRHTASYPDIDTLIDVWNIFCGGTTKRKTKF